MQYRIRQGNVIQSYVLDTTSYDGYNILNSEVTEENERA